MPANRLKQARRQPNRGSFRKGDPRINRQGRPKAFGDFVQVLQEEGEELAVARLRKAMGQSGRVSPVNLKAIELWLAYCRGRPVQAHTVMATGRVQVEEAEDLSRLSVEELRAYRELRAKTVRPLEPPPASP
jgi:hypothetical protein